MKNNSLIIVTSDDSPESIAALLVKKINDHHPEIDCTGNRIIKATLVKPIPNDTTRTTTTRKFEDNE